MTTNSPEALRQAIERLELITAKAAHLIRWTESDAHDLAVVLSALQEAREALGPFEERCRHAVRPDDLPNDGVTVRVRFLRRAAEVFRALSPGGADE